MVIAENANNSTFPSITTRRHRNVLKSPINYPDYPNTPEFPKYPLDTFVSGNNHQHLVCPLKPFAHLIASCKNQNYDLELLLQNKNHDFNTPYNLSSSTPKNSQKSSNKSSNNTLPLSISLFESSKIEHVSDSLKNKLSTVLDKNKLVGKSIGDIASFENSNYNNKSNIWQFFNKVFSASSAASNAYKNSIFSENQQTTIPAQHGSSGTVRLAQINSCHPEKMFVLMCAHILPVVDAKKWWSWNHKKSSGINNTTSPELDTDDISLCIVHVTEVTALHKISCLGLNSLLPPPIRSIWKPSISSSNKNYSGSSNRLSNWPTSPSTYSLNSKKKFVSLLVSRHAIIEMAFPLSPSKVYFDQSNSFKTDSFEVLSLSNVLGESLFTNVHPEDCPRLLKALSITWDAKPDFYYYHENTYNKQYRQKVYDKSIQNKIELDREYREDGIIVENALVELTIQWCFKSLFPNKQNESDGNWRDFDWDDPQSLETSCRFVKVRLCRWPVPKNTQKPNFGSRPQSRLNSANNSESNCPRNDSGFVLLDLSILEHKTNVMKKLDSESRNISNRHQPSENSDSFIPRNNSLNYKGPDFSKALSNLEKSITLFSLSKFNKVYSNDSSQSIKFSSNTLYEPSPPSPPITSNLDRSNLCSYQLTKSSNLSSSSNSININADTTTSSLNIISPFALPYNRDPIFPPNSTDADSLLTNFVNLKISNTNLLHTNKIDPILSTEDPNLTQNLKNQINFKNTNKNISNLDSTISNPDSSDLTIKNIHNILSNPNQNSSIAENSLDFVNIGNSHSDNKHTQKKTIKSLKKFSLSPESPLHIHPTHHPHYHTQLQQQKQQQQQQQLHQKLCPKQPISSNNLQPPDSLSLHNLLVKSKLGFCPQTRIIDPIKSPILAFAQK
ncbi:hypothetical protein AYI69_g89 [Smittium culicis]|uniref:Uncharacterized protein n=1 Tax=Smittium culicis TaxID=133412 RepID=A0A1R1YTZ8_9FUNG|nr:hypothetical protein AYI69_g89 [Smittium culicis]